MKVFRRDNRGSGIVTVLVAMLLLTALGASLLFASYTGFLIKVAERKSGENFYDAETVMSEVRSGIQRAVTESIATAYEQVLLEYNTSKDTEGDFHAKFEQAMFAWRSEEGEKLLNRLDNYMTYVPSTLESFIDIPEGAQVELSCPSPLVRVRAEAVTDADGNILKDESGNARMRDVSISLLGISVKYTDAEGYETSVSTDIDVILPDFDYSLTEYSLTGVPEFAMVARQGLIQTANNVVLELTGNAYAGSMDLTQTGTTLNIRGGTLICGGDVNVEGYSIRPHLTVESDASLWANRISVGPNTAVALSGEAYVADDLELYGAYSSATVAGKYYGFGYLSDEELARGVRYYCLGCGHTDALNHSPCPVCGRTNSYRPYAESVSSIVINGRNTSLDLSGVTDLVLAGNSFVDTGSGGFTGSGVVMGQSVSVRSDQMAYLLPKDCVKLIGTDGKSTPLPSNPYSFTGTVRPQWTLDTEAVAKHGLDEYVSLVTAEDGTQTVRGVQPVFSNLPSTGTPMVYFYISFQSRADANDYFIDYFSTHADSISNYLKLYSTRLTAAEKMLTSGTAYDLDAQGELSLLRSSGETSLSVSAAKYRERYLNMCVTLSSRSRESTPTPKDKNGNALVKNPFDYVVNRLALPESTTEFRDADNKVLGVIFVGEHCNVSQFDPNVRVIIATGDVSVDSHFTGLVVSDGTVTMNASLFSSPDQVTGALRARNAEGATLLSFLNVGDDEYSGSENRTGAATWDTYSLVHYTNWTKA